MNHTQIKELYDAQAEHILYALANPENYPQQDFELLNVVYPEWYLSYIDDTRGEDMFGGRRAVTRYCEEAYQDFIEGRRSIGAWILARTIYAVNEWEATRSDKQEESFDFAFEVAQ